jgi:hypothetical protein
MLGHRKKRPAQVKSTLSEAMILVWVDDHKARTGNWPKRTSGPIRGTAHETWSAVDGALFQGNRGLKGGVSLIQLLARHRGYRHRNFLPRLRINDNVA